MSEEMKNVQNPQAAAAPQKEPEQAPAKVYPCIPLRGVSIFPNTVVQFVVG